VHIKKTDPNLKNKIKKKQIQTIDHWQIAMPDACNFQVQQYNPLPASKGSRHPFGATLNNTE
jgi:hypothetical protein